MNIGGTSLNGRVAILRKNTSSPYDSRIISSANPTGAAPLYFQIQDDGVSQMYINTSGDVNVLKNVIVAPAPTTGSHLCNKTYVDSVSGSLFKAKVSLSSAQILAGHTSPVEVVPAKGAGTLIVVHSVVYKYNFITSAYTGGTSSLEITYTGSSEVLQFANSILDSVVDIRRGGTGAMFQATDMPENTGISVQVPSAVSGGDSTADVYITYETITL